MKGEQGMTNQNATWYKVVGDDSGLIKLGKLWIRFKCLHCARRLHPLVFDGDRWQGPPSRLMASVLSGMGLHVIPCNGAEFHKRRVS